MYKNNCPSHQYTWSNLTEIWLHRVEPDGIIYYKQGVIILNTVYNMNDNIMDDITLTIRNKA